MTRSQRCGTTFFVGSIANSWPVRRYSSYPRGISEPVYAALSFIHLRIFSFSSFPWSSHSLPRWILPVPLIRTLNPPPHTRVSQECPQSPDGCFLNAESKILKVLDPVRGREYEDEHCSEHSLRRRRRIETPRVLNPRSQHTSGPPRTHTVPPLDIQENRKTLQPKDLMRRYQWRRTLPPPRNPSTDLASRIIPGKPSFSPATRVVYHAETPRMAQTYKKRPKALTAATRPRPSAERQRK